jgi:biopolymer transport protein ExbB
MHGIISDSILKAVEQGILGLLMVLGLACIGVFSWRWRAVNRIRAGATPWRTKLQHALTDDMLLSGLVTNQLSQTENPAERMVNLGLLNAHLCPDALEKILESQEIRERESLERGAQLLGTVGANAPFLGLTGTVIGILSAFRQMATQGGAGGVEVMAAIAGALVATAAGLMVAIPAVVLYNLLKARIRKTMNTLGEIRSLILARSLQAVAKEVF